MWLRAYNCLLVRYSSSGPQIISHIKLHITTYQIFPLIHSSCTPLHILLYSNRAHTNFVSQLGAIEHILYTRFALLLHHVHSTSNIPLFKHICLLQYFIFWSPFSAVNFVLHNEIISVAFSRFSYKFQNATGSEPCSCPLNTTLTQYIIVRLSH